MSKVSRSVAAVALIVLGVTTCKNETSEPSEPAAFAFTVYPGSRYLAALTELFKRAAPVINPNTPPPPIAIYDTDAPLEKVADWYVQSYGYAKVAPDATNNLSAAKPPAFYRSGDLQTDVKAIKDLLQKLNTKTDISKAQGKYRAVEIESKMNRPRVTLQRPYFDVTQSQVIDRTMILMAP